LLSAGRQAVAEGCPFELAERMTRDHLWDLSRAHARPPPHRRGIYVLPRPFYEIWRADMVRAYEATAMATATATSLLCEVWRTNHGVDMARPIEVMYIRDSEHSLAMLFLKAREDFLALHVGILVIEWADWRTVITHGEGRPPSARRPIGPSAHRPIGPSAFPVNDQREITYLLERYTATY
jgi:hypothetical protein